MLRRWQAIRASTSNGRKRKSVIILVTSKSKKLGRASAMVGFHSGGSLLCGAQRTKYRLLPVCRQEKFLQCSKIRRSARAHFPLWSELVPAIARPGGAGRRVPPLSARDRLNRRAATLAKSPNKRRLSF